MGLKTVEWYEGRRPLEEYRDLYSGSVSLQAKLVDQLSRDLHKLHKDHFSYERHEIIFSAAKVKANNNVAGIIVGYMDYATVFMQLLEQK